MWNRLTFLFVGLVSLGNALAQDGPAAPTRAQRDADNPLRMIIEAGKIKPRAAPAEPERPRRAPERIQVRAVAPAAAPAPTSPSTTAPEAAATAATPATPATAATAAAAAPAPVAPASPAPASPAPAVPLATAQTPPSPPVAAATPEPARAAVARQPDLPPAAVGEPSVAAAPAATDTSAVAAAALQLAHMVEPVIPRRLRERVRGEIEVVVSFTVNSDGSVSGVAVQSSSQPLVDATVLDAVSQWRYGPIPAPRSHAVQLVLRPGGG